MRFAVQICCLGAHYRSYESTMIDTAVNILNCPDKIGGRIKAQCKFFTVTVDSTQNCLMKAHFEPGKYFLQANVFGRKFYGKAVTSKAVKRS